MKIKIETVNHKSQAYDTVGDYGRNKDGLWIKVSDMKNDTYHLAVVLHELIELHLCELAGISFALVNEFDLAYEKRRAKGDRHADCGCLIQPEVGNDVHAPYHEEHVFATKLEKEFLQEAAWRKYDKTVDDL
jgi:hypothetical protein